MNSFMENNKKEVVRLAQEIAEEAVLFLMEDKDARSASKVIYFDEEAVLQVKVTNVLADRKVKYPGVISKK